MQPLRASAIMLRAPAAVAFCAFLLVVTALAAKAEPVYVPPELEPWVDWVLEAHPNLQCPRDTANGKPGRCAWVSSLDIDIASALEFTMTVQVFAKTRVDLPGDRTNWPVNVKSRGDTLAVIGGNSSPAVVLEPGNYNINGRINWGERPTSLRLPAYTGLINLNVDGNSVARPSREGNRLILGKRDSELETTERNSLSVDVFRQISDDYPMMMQTQLVLRVSGQPRIETIGQVMLDNFEMMGFESDLPARLTSDGNLQIQVEAGAHDVFVAARALSTPTQLSPGPATPAWPKQEIWGFMPKRELRLVQLSGANPIDLSQTDAPFDETDTQGYLLNADSVLNIEVTQRGNPNPPPNRFQISRDLWLNFDGKGYIVSDNLNAAISHPSRLSASYELGRVSVDGDNELINSLDGQAPGIELPSGDYQITANSQIDRSALTSATGWQLDTDNLRAELHLPPGWRLLWASGVDVAPQSWIAQWSLWKIFVLVLLGVLAFRFLSKGFALALVVSGILMMHTAQVLAVAWLVAVGLVAAVRHIEHQAALRWFTAGAAVWLGITALIAISDAVDHARQAIYPQLEHYSAVPEYRNTYSGDKAKLDMAVPESSMMAEPSSSIQDRVIEEVVVTASRMERYSPASITAAKTKYAEGLQVQTGPAAPNWRWNRADLIWDGPVDANQPLQLHLLPPSITRLINLAVATLLIAITGLLLLSLLPAGTRSNLPTWLGRIAPAVLAATIALPGADASAAETPGAEVLKQLETRLLQPPRCMPNCASLTSATIRGNEQSFTIELRLHSDALVSVPLPGSSVWAPNRIELDGDAATVGSQANGQLQLALPAGTHSVLMSGAVSHLERFELNMPLTPADVTLELSSAWQVTGLVRGKVARGTLGFDRAATATAAMTDDETLKPDPAKPFVRIYRTLEFGQEWTLTTDVERNAPEAGGFSLRVPLLFNEEVLDQEITIANGTAQLVFGRNDSEISWVSRLVPRESLTLTAPALVDRSEQWELVPSNFWHVEHSGLTALNDGDQYDGLYFAPEAGESLTVDLTRTTPVPGATVTIQAASHRITVGARQQTHLLTISTLASLGGTLPLTLADQDNTLLSVAVNDEQQPLSLIDNVLPLPIAPGQSSYNISWQENTPRSTVLRIAPPALNEPVSNITSMIEMARDRWVLLLGGPALGPGILYWGMLLVVLLLAFAIARIPGLPFSVTDAILLSLGLSLANLPATLLVAVWVIALRFRGKLLDGLSHNWSKNMLQLASAGLSVITLITLVVSVPQALIGNPDMQIEGNGSSAYLYRWFTDQTAGAFPSAWVLSVPIWIYRVIMLAWSLWLAFALIRWVPWAWRQWSQPSIFYRSAPAAGFSAKQPTTEGQPPSD